MNLKNHLDVSARAKRGLGLGVALLLGTLATAANAVPCAPSYENNVLANAGCQVGTTNNDLLNPLQVNEDAIFGFTDWSFAQRDNDVNGTDTTTIDIGLLLTGTTLAGT